MNRTHLITDLQIRSIQSELKHLQQYCIHTPDTEASFKSIYGLLQSISGT